MAEIRSSEKIGCFFKILGIVFVFVLICVSKYIEDNEPKDPTSIQAVEQNNQYEDSCQEIEQPASYIETEAIYPMDTVEVDVNKAYQVDTAEMDVDEYYQESPAEMNVEDMDY